MTGTGKTEPVTAIFLSRLRSAAATLTKGVLFQSRVPLRFTLELRLRSTALASRSPQLSYISLAHNLELMTVIEPVTSPLPRECSTN